MKSLLRKLSRQFKSHRAAADPVGPSPQQDLELDSLEGRILFSAAPVEAPDQAAGNPDGEAPTADVQIESPEVTVNAQSAQAATAELDQAESASEAPLPASAETEISADQGITLVEVTPNAIRLRKRHLDPHERKRAARAAS